MSRLAVTTVEEAKHNLMMSLGDNWQTYAEYLKLWFRMKWSKEEFDIASRRLLRPEQILLHNIFIITILSKIDAVNKHVSKTTSYDSYTSSAAKRRKKNPKQNEHATFEPADIYDYLPDDDKYFSIPQSQAGNPAPTIRYAAQELFLPDYGLIWGRLLVGAWENGLMNADENSVEILVTAVQVFLKNIISAVIMKKKHCRYTGNGAFYYDIGCALKNPEIRNTVTRSKIDDEVLELDREIRSGSTMRKPTDESQYLPECEEM